MLVAKGNCRPVFFGGVVNKEYVQETALLADELEEDDRNEQIHIKQEVSKAKAGRGENRYE